MFPVPTVAESAVIKALNGLTSPGTGRVGPIEKKPEAVADLAPGMNTRPRVSNTPVTPSMPSIGGPHAKALIESMTEFSRSMGLSKRHASGRGTVQGGTLTLCAGSLPAKVEEPVCSLMTDSKYEFECLSKYCGKRQRVAQVGH